MEIVTKDEAVMRTHWVIGMVSGMAHLTHLKMQKKQQKIQADQSANIAVYERFANFS